MSLEISTLIIIFTAYAKTWILQIIAWPLIKNLFKNLPDNGWALGRMFSLIIGSLLLWETSFLGLPTNTHWGLLAVLLLMLAVSVMIIKKQGWQSLALNREICKFVLLEEYLFFVGFGIICFVRSYLPNLDSLEKFMDYGFIVRYLNSPTLPAMDMWQVGKAINYYSYGHYWASILIRFWNVQPEIGYNLVLGFIAGISLNLSFLVISIFSKTFNKKDSLVGAFLGSFVVVFGGNSHTLWYLIKNLSLKDYWYADATRFIYNTIHEFPGYSLVVSDLHGHVFDLPIALIFIIVFYLFSTKERLFEQITLGIIFAVMMMTNTWDVPIYGLLLCVWFTIKIIANIHNLGNVVRSSIVIFGTMILVSLPWWVNFVPISNGVGIVTLRSPLWQLGALWGLALLTNIITWFLSAKSTSKWQIRTLILTSILLVIIPEIVFAKDIYPDHPRANTMFKLTYQAFIMSSLVFGVLMNIVIEQFKAKKRIISILTLVLCLGVFGSVMIFPVLSFPSFYENFEKFRGLNGEVWLKEKIPENYEVIQFLKKNKNGKNLVEAVGDSYTDFNAVSVFSGVPSIEGWRVHEWLWRGGYESVSTREQQVKEVYEGENIAKTEAILKLYNIGWILVGLNEREKYKINEVKVKSLGEMVWEMDESYLIEIK